MTSFPFPSWIVGKGNNKSQDNRNGFQLAQVSHVWKIYFAKYIAERVFAWHLFSASRVALPAALHQKIPRFHWNVILSKNMQRCAFYMSIIFEKLYFKYDITNACFSCDVLEHQSLPPSGEVELRDILLSHNKQFRVAHKCESSFVDQRKSANYHSLSIILTALLLILNNTLTSLKFPVAQWRLEMTCRQQGNLFLSLSSDAFPASGFLLFILVFVLLLFQHIW